MPNSSTFTLLDTIEWAKTMNFGRSFALGNYLQPATMSANMVVQTMLGAPFCWRWNRVVTGFIAVPGIQDYTLTNWNPSTVVGSNWYVIDSNGNSQSATGLLPINTTSSTSVSPGIVTVTVSSITNMADGVFVIVDTGINQETVEITATGAGNFTATFTKSHTEPFSVINSNYTGLTIPIWNQTLGGATDDGNIIWTNQGPIPVDIPLNSAFTFSWMETQSVYDISLSPPKWIEIQSKISLGLDSTEARPKWISAQGDDGLGDITFRLMQTPDQAYPVAITIQQKPPIFTSVNQTWAPIPDEYSHIYNWGFLSLMWMFADDSRFTFASQKFIAHLLSASEGLSETEFAIFLNNWQQITGAPIGKADRLQQGYQGRSAV
jgi:hypothetical protein